jgi:hypothetical protein
LNRGIAALLVLFAAVIARADLCADRSAAVRVPKGLDEKIIATKMLKCYCPVPDEKLGSPTSRPPLNTDAIKEISGSDLDKKISAAVDENLRSVVFSTMPEHDTQIAAWRILAGRKTLTFVEVTVSTPENKVPNYYCGFTLIEDEQVSIISKRACRPNLIPYEQVAEGYSPFDVVNDFNGRPAIVATHNSSVGATGGGDLALLSQRKAGWEMVGNGCGWGD